MTRAVLRPKGQITLPAAVRSALHIDEGDDVSFEVTDDGVILRGMKSIRADQAWFWTTDWQAGEREIDADLAAGAGQKYPTTQQFVEHLRSLD